MNQEHSTESSESSALLLRQLVMQLLKILLFILAALAVLIVGTRAWFVANSQVAATDTGISARQERIRLATKGAYQLPETRFLHLESGSEFLYGQETYYCAEDNAIALLLDHQAQAVVSPGAGGQVTFYVISGSNDAQTLRLYVRLAGYRGIWQNGEVTDVEPVSNAVLTTLLNGHILLFREKRSGWLGSGEVKEITVRIPENSGNIPVPVTLYWTWPARYREDVVPLAASDPAFGQWLEAQNTLTGTAWSGTTDNAADYGYSGMFLAYMDTNLENPQAQDDAYNLADEFIGTNAQYLYLSIRTAP